MAERPDVPEEMLDRLNTIAEALPECRQEPAWVGVRWRVGQATIAHVFGGEDRRFRITLRGDPEDVRAFEHLGPPYFRAEWGRNVIGMILDDATDWAEVAELLIVSYVIQAPARLASRIALPESRPGSD
ncbi:MAG TPA: MmcQ/YjbR family DNA-binding protein [Tetrasphaera sp.]|uniref:MmcQ/YjbR family DNA-binding protein n=1 Tax=Nostocoides sp. TaxID=1917966 RepID=UPI002BA0943B|nr:MmcQ/YjbR family DNA-binding protein [Tetrasphaera sp.]HNQ06128.1 MmcQ/YjbR family DNA-binding protein [Tetrasphaera sp.]